ncbi:MAG: repair protein RecO [Bacteroidota bacterium]|jgi:DNA repair protein RecO (recombination protein O)
MTHKTKGIVLRAVKYGETSLVVTIFTELFGIQTYMVNGVRSSKKGSSKAAFFQPAAMLDLEVYHNDQKSMHRIKECNWHVLYERIFSEVVKNCIALYITELLHKCLRQPEQQTDLFEFCEDVFLSLDQANGTVAANLPLFFALQLPQFFGFKMNNEDVTEYSFLDLQEGCFTEIQPHHPHFLDYDLAAQSALLLQVQHPDELAEIKLNQAIRRKLLHSYHQYFNLQLPEFGTMKTIAVLYDVL